MNNLYFACIECKIYIDAGYRWAYWQLEQVVIRGEEVSVKAVLAEKNYWNPPEDQNSRWLYQGVFPPLREFFREHDGHTIVFGEESDFVPPDHEFEWMQVGYMLMPTPRYLVEVLGLKSWDEVVAYMQKQNPPPAWWEVTWEGNPSPHQKGKEKFDELVKRTESMGPQL